MDFRRKLSSGGDSFSEGTSRFFSSVLAKTNGLKNDLSNKIESVGATLMKSSPSGSSLSDNEEEAPGANYDEEYSPSTSSSIPKSKKNQENSAEKLSSTNRTSRAPGRHYRRQESHSSNGSAVTDDNYSSTGANMSFDEPLYSPNRVTTPERSSSVGPSWKGRHTPPAIPPPPFNPNKTGRRSSRSSTNSPKMSSGHSSDSEKYMDGDKNLYDEKNRASSGDEKVTNEEKPRPPSFAQTKRRSSTVDEMLFDDYVEPTPEEKKPEPEPQPEQEPEDDSVFQKRKKTLLPMGDLISFDEPELEDFHPKPLTERKKVRSTAVKNADPSLEKSYPSNSSVASSDAEFDERNLYNQTSVDSSEPEYERDHSRRLNSVGSERSWSSNYSLDSQPDDLTLECMGFMKGFVDKIFNISEDIPQMEKAKFGEFCQQVPGRQWFARYVNSQRVVSKKVEESIFFRLVQYFAVVLFECNEAEDFVPAKNLMNMCFTFYHESRQGKQRRKNFLYSYLREQPIWQSLRFWNAAFFDAVQNERARKPVCTREDAQDSQTDDSMFQENITFGQLGTFTCNMRAFGLSKDLCVEFLRKQSIIADLKAENNKVYSQMLTFKIYIYWHIILTLEQIKMLKENIDKWKEP